MSKRRREVEEEEVEAEEELEREETTSEADTPAEKKNRASASTENDVDVEVVEDMEDGSDDEEEAGPSNGDCSQMPVSLTRKIESDRVLGSGISFIHRHDRRVRGMF